MILPFPQIQEYLTIFSFASLETTHEFPHVTMSMVLRVFLPSKAVITIVLDLLTLDPPSNGSFTIALYVTWPHIQIGQTLFLTDGLKP